MNFVYPVGATPLDPSEIEDLIPQQVSTLAMLNEWEQANILEAESWLSKQNHYFNDIMTFKFIQKLHYKMFDKTWKWAGLFRQTNKNIGTDWVMITEELKKLIDDIQYQVNNKIYIIDEIAARFHHRLVAVHLFPNGNGRHARLMADVLLLPLDNPRFSWGQNSLNNLEVRENYIAALRAADKNDYKPLFKFVRG